MNNEKIVIGSGGDYASKRHLSYPKIKDQLDMIWHAMERGEIPVAAEFFDAIKAVKDKYPKDKQ